MDSSVLDTSRQATPRRPVTANCIDEICPRKVAGKQHYVFDCVLIDLNSPPELRRDVEVELPAAALDSYAAFRRTLLAKHGVHYRDPAMEDRRPGWRKAALWSELVADAMVSPAEGGAS